uniref:DUF4283 domain-containing protein n=1 Tax=Caenorhabditis tropicalis TaxID=1561998 RepID=A0A1I7T1R1_9PELO
MDAVMMKKTAMQKLGQGRMKVLVPRFTEGFIVKTSALNIELAIPPSAINDVERTFSATIQEIGFLVAEAAYSLQPRAKENMVQGESTMQWEEFPEPQGVVHFRGQAKPCNAGWRLDIFIKKIEDGIPKIVGFGTSSLRHCRRMSAPLPVRSHSNSPAASAQVNAAPAPTPPPAPSSSQRPSTTLKRASSSLQMTRKSKLSKELAAVADQEPTSSTRPTSSTNPAAIVAPEPAASIVPEVIAFLSEKMIKPLYVTREVIPVKMSSRAVFYFHVTAEDVPKMNSIMMRGGDWPDHFNISLWEGYKRFFFAPAVSIIEIIELFFLSKMVMFDSVKHGIPWTDDLVSMLQNKANFRKAIRVSKHREQVLMMLNARGKGMFQELEKRI